MPYAEFKKIKVKYSDTNLRQGFGWRVKYISIFTQHAVR
jgi:hypothetical protein